MSLSVSFYSLNTLSSESVQYCWNVANIKNKYIQKLTRNNLLSKMVAATLLFSLLNHHLLSQYSIFKDAFKQVNVSKILENHNLNMFFPNMLKIYLVKSVVMFPGLLMQTFTILL